MKTKYYLLGLAGIVLTGVLGFVLMQDHTPTYTLNKYADLSNAVGRADYGAQYYHMLREDEDGEIKLKDVLRSRRMVEEHSYSAKNPASEIYWNYRGPNFVGGRTRGLWQDNSVPNSSVMFAGSVSGGIFISYNHGEKWYDYNSNITNLSISSITQTSNSVLFVATGSSHEGGGMGFRTETGHPGDGVFRREEDGNGGHTFTRIVGPNGSNLSASAEWRQVNKILGHPTDPNKLYVGTRGFKVTTNPHDDEGEVTFTEPIQAGGNPFGGIVDDIAINSVGDRVYVTSGRTLYVLQDNGGDDIVEIGQHMFGFSTRMAVAVAPSDDSVIYVVGVHQEGTYQGCLQGVYQSRDGGKNWTKIGSPAASFDPFKNVGTNCQGNYDQAIAVFPDNPGKIIIGGVHLWQWEESKTSFGNGTWSQIAVTQDGGLADTNYVHADKHRILITTPNVIYIASDGGIGKSVDGGQTWYQANDGFNVTQFYAMDASYGFSFEQNGQNIYIQQMIGGTQDNGTQLVGLNSNRPFDGFEVSGGDGFDCAFSNYGNLAFSTIYNGSLMRVSQGGGVETIFDEELEENCPDCGPFYTRLGYWERAYAPKTFDSIKYEVKTTIEKGDTITYPSAIGGLPMKWPAPKTVGDGDSLYLPDFNQSKLVFWTGADGLYMTRDAPKLNTIGFDWSKIANSNASQTTPDALQGTPFCFAFSKDGNQLFIGTEGGNVYRIDNLNEGYNDATLDIRKPGCVLTCTKINSTSVGFVNSISVDPNNPDNLVVTTGGFGGNIYVRYCTNASTALSNQAFFRSIQGDLPAMPCYASLIGENSEKQVLVGTEFGVWGTENADAAAPNWSQTRGMPNVPVYQLRQITDPVIYSDTGQGLVEIPTFNFRHVYAGTCGRGFYSSTNLVGIDDGDGPIVSKKEDQIQFSIYPNPLKGSGTISLNSTKEQDAIIQVFDLNGKVIATVFNGMMKAGNQKIEFNVDHLKNGTYIARMQSGNDMQIAKFVVLK